MVTFVVPYLGKRPFHDIAEAIVPPELVCKDVAIWTDTGNADARPVATCCLQACPGHLEVRVAFSCHTQEQIWAIRMVANGQDLIETIGRCQCIVKDRVHGKPCLGRCWNVLSTGPAADHKVIETQPSHLQVLGQTEDKWDVLDVVYRDGISYAHTYARCLT